MSTSPVEITWRNLTLRTEKNKNILNNISGRADPGTMTAILGPSGSGKTTFMNSIAGRINSELTLDGQILVNGRDRDPKTWPEIASYVGQVFYAHEWLTVYESMKFAAQAKLGSNLSIEKRVSDTLNMLGMHEARDTLVEKLSGGERMRLSIGIELIGEPSAIFLDEPTSGLDSANALNILSILRRLAVGGKTIIVTIHQPSYEMLKKFDSLILMCQGSPIYDGNVDGCIKFFSDCGFDLPRNTNPSDFFLDTISSDSSSDKNTEKIVSALKKEWNFIREEKKPRLNKIVQVSEKPKNFSVLIFLLQREFLNSIRNKPFLMAKLFQKVFIAFLLGFTYFRLGISDADVFSLRGVITFLVINELFGISGPILNQFPQSRKIIERERMSGFYSGYEAYFSQSISTILQNFVFEIPYIILIYYLIQLNLNFGRLVVFIIIVCSLVVFSVSFGLTVSTISATTEVAQALGITLNILFILYSGAFSNPNTIPAAFRWLIWISPACYGFRAALQNQLDGQTVKGVSGEELIDSFGISGIGVWPCILILLGYSLAVQAVGAYVLHNKTKSNLKISSSSKPEIVYE